MNAKDQDFLTNLRILHYIPPLFLLVWSSLRKSLFPLGIYLDIFMITSHKYTHPEKITRKLKMAYPKPRSERLLMRSASTATKYSSF